MTAGHQPVNSSNLPSVRRLEGKVQEDVRIIAKREGWPRNVQDFAHEYAAALVRPNRASRKDADLQTLAKAHPDAPAKVQAAFLYRLRTTLPFPGIADLQFTPSTGRAT